MALAAAPLPPRARAPEGGGGGRGGTAGPGRRRRCWWPMARARAGRECLPGLDRPRTGGTAGADRRLWPDGSGSCAAAAMATAHPDGSLDAGDDWVALRAGSDHVEIHAIARTDMPSGMFRPRTGGTGAGADEGCGLTAAGSCAAACYRAPDSWTLMQGDDWVALRAGSDHVEIHAIARTDMPSGDVSRADTGAMDSVGGHAAGAQTRAWARRADIPGVQASCARWRPPDRRGSSGSAGFHPWWPHDVPAEQGREIEAGADVAPGWTRCRRTCARMHARVHGLQQAFRAAELRAVHGREQAILAPGPPAVARRSRAIGVRVPVGRGHASGLRHRRSGLRYADGALDVEMAPGARRDPAPEGARQTGSRRRPRTAYPSSRRRLAPPRAAGRGTREPLMSFAFRPLAAAPFAAGRKRIADWRARAGN